MESELSSRLETVVSRLDGKESCLREVDDSYDYYSPRGLSSSPAEAVFGDSPSERADDMAIEDTCELNWDDDANLTTPCDTGLGPIALPPPSSYIPVPRRGVETPNYNADLEQLFNPDQNNDCLGSASPGVCGLCNLGNTCFMNSGLQCLLNTPPMIQFFLAHARENASSDNLAAHLANLFQKIWSGKYNKVKPTEFHQALASQHSQFKDYRQHDCQEFLALLLGTLHELLNTASSKSHVSDLSVDPMTPRSVCDATATDVAESDSTSQTGLPSVGLRYEMSSSSSRSSESSISTSHIRLRPIPDEVQPFKIMAPASSTLWEAMDSISETSDAMLTCDETEDLSTTSLYDTNTNVISQAALKRDQKVVNVAAALNNVQPCFGSYEDILKDAKTSNVNVLVAESGANNQIVFDSDKFPKHENTRRRDTLENPNLTEFHNFEGKTVSVKRIKEINKLQDQNESVTDCNDSEATEFYTNNSNKRFKLEENLEKEKNVRMEYERKLRDGDKATDVDVGEFSGATSLQHVTTTVLDDDLEADKQWEKHLGHNQSVIVDSFQGQFKSTVVCSECNHVSSTYEPFMYLSVPLPHAMEQQLCVTFVPANSNPPTQYLLTLKKQDKIIRIKEELRSLMNVNVTMNLELAEVLHHHIARILDENHFIRHVGLSDPHRSIYAFEISDDVICTACDDLECDSYTTEPLDLTPEQVHLNNVENQCRNDSKISSFTNNLKTDCEMVSDFGPQLPGEESGRDTSDKTTEECRTCAICLEEVEKGLKNHKGCSCFLCDSCIERSVKHYNSNQEEGNVMKCPVCNVVVSPLVDFVAAEEAGDMRTSIRMLKIPVLFRRDREPCEDENRDERLFGHPHLIKVASRLLGAELYRVIAKLVPYHSNYSIVLVDGQGYHCSRCLYNERCKGCLVSPDSEVILQTSDNLAVRFTLPIVEIPSINHRSLQERRKQEQLSLYDCLDAFSESETLDEHNPWYCPMCQRNQCATKTLSVWRYPDFLIVYLKRFVFHEYTSVKLDNKVSFPLTDLTLVPPSGIQAGLSRSYNLYACVNHLGGASAGHYTAYTRNPVSGEWHLFNDENVTVQEPHDGDFSNAYILFYQKQGMQINSGVLNSFLTGGSIKANIDQIILNLDSNSAGQHSWRKEMALL